MKPIASLVPMGTLTAQLGDQIELGSGPEGGQTDQRRCVGRG